MKITRPLLAVACEDIAKLEFPLIATPKLDGVRILKVDGKVLTRNFKPLPNVYVRTVLEDHLPEGADGELMLRDPKAQFNEIQSAFMSRDGQPQFIFHAFDIVDPSVGVGLHTPYIDRVTHLILTLISLDLDYIVSVPHQQINSVEELQEYEAAMVNAGYEGVMVRKSDGRYKCGRSTLKEGILLKIKRFTDAEGVLVGFEELYRNENALEEDKFGLAKRSSKLEGMKPAGTLGKLIVRLPDTNIEFGIGTGFTQAMRDEIWRDRESLLGKFVKFKFQECGQKEAPRFPVFLGFRSELDM